MFWFYAIQFIMNLMVSIAWSNKTPINLLIKMIFIILTIFDVLIIAKMLNISQLLFAI